MVVVADPRPVVSLLLVSALLAGCGSGGSGGGADPNGSSQAIRGTSVSSQAAGSSSTTTASDPGKAFNSGPFTYNSATQATSSTGPTIELIADVAFINPGDPVNLSWTSEDADSCSAAGYQGDGTWVGSQATQGAALIPAVTDAAYFGIECENASGTSTAWAFVDLASPTINWVAPGAGHRGEPAFQPCRLRDFLRHRSR